MFDQLTLSKAFSRSLKTINVSRLKSMRTSIISLILNISMDLNVKSFVLTNSLLLTY